MASNESAKVKVIDSHTEGEPTRVVVSGGPDLGNGTMQERIARLAADHDELREMLVLEPRGTDALVGALLCEPTRSDCATGVLFFDNEEYLGMCGHGSIGTVVTLAHLGRIDVGKTRLETPVGVVTVDLIDRNTVTIENVPSYRYRKDVTVNVPGLGDVTGDVAWGGNWFFIADSAPRPINVDNERELTSAALDVQQTLRDRGITGKDGSGIDHIIFGGDSSTADNRHFVLCPSGTYDRSPCGTGTSARLACLAEDGVLEPGKEWVQESVIGSQFTASYRLNDRNEVIPSITGRAFICAETTLIRQINDPFRNGIRPK